MSLEVKKNANEGNKVVVDVDVANIVKYLCITSIIIVSIVFGSKIFSKIFEVDFIMKLDIAN